MSQDPDWREGEEELPILVSLPSHYKKSYADVLFTLNHWVRVHARSDLIDFYSHKIDKFSFLYAFISIWKPILFYIIRSKGRPNYIVLTLKQILLNIVFSLSLLSSWIFSFRRKKKPLDISNQEKAFTMIQEEYIDFVKRESWYNYDFLARFKAYITVKNDENVPEHMDYLTQFNHVVACCYLIIKIAVATPLNFMRNKFGNIDDFYIVLEIEGTERNSDIDSFGDCKYIGFKKNSFYVQALKYRDLKTYLMKIEKPAKILSVADMETILVGCIVDKSYPLQELLFGEPVFQQKLADGRVRYVFEVRTARAKTFLKKIHDTPVKLEGYLPF